MAEDSWIVDLRDDPERFVKGLDVKKVRGRQSFINQWLDHFSTRNGERLAVKLKDRPDLMEELWQAFSKQKGVSDSVIEQAKTDGVKFEKAFTRATKKYTEETLKLIKKFDASIKRQFNVQSYKKAGAKVSAYQKTSPKPFTNNEIEFLKNHLFENINDVYIQYIKVFEDGKRTLSSLETKLVRLRKEGAAQ